MERKYNDRMVVSAVNQLDSFPYPGNELDFDISDGDEIISLNSIGEKVLQFKENILYIVNIASNIPGDFFIEERHKFKGLSHFNHVIETEDGIFWINKFGAYLYDGEELKDLHFDDDEDRERRKISQSKWSSFISNESMVGYNPSSKECIIVKSHSHSVSSDGDCYIFNLTVNSWTYGKAKFFVGDSNEMTNLINLGDNSQVGCIYNAAYSDEGSEPMYKKGIRGRP